MKYEWFCRLGVPIEEEGVEPKRRELYRRWAQPFIPYEGMLLLVPLSGTSPKPNSVKPMITLVTYKIDDGSFLINLYLDPITGAEYQRLLASGWSLWDSEKEEEDNE